jgi:two-component system, NtrC family, sensor kinase
MGRRVRRLLEILSTVRVKIIVGVAVVLIPVITGMTFILVDLPRHDLVGQLRMREEWTSLLQVIGIESGLILLLISLLLTLLVAKPIEALVHVAERIAEGDLSYRVDVVQQGEIGRLAVAFNRMLERLEESRAAQERQIRDLEQAYAALKRTQAQLVASEKLASVGRLAAGVAHEIGNPLSSIHGYSEILLLDETTSERRQYIERIQMETERITRIIQSLLDYSRPGKPASRQRVDLGAVVQKTLYLVRAQRGFSKVQLTSAGLASGPEVLADENALTQVLINLLLNAQQAAGEAGRIEVVAGRTSDGWPPAGGAWPEPTPAMLPAAYVAVRDNGPGIAAGDQDKIFEPFFTTKPVGLGTGLGLFVVHNILESLGGEVRLWSEPGQGTCFVVFLPEAQGQAAAD